MNLRARLLTIGLLASISTLSVNCGGGSSSKPLTTTDFCSMWAGAVCQFTAHCGATLTLADCTTQAIAQCTTKAAAAMESGVRAFTAANVGTAVSTASSVFVKTSGITPADLAKVENTFQYVFQGQVAKMATCTVKYDCAGGQDAVICDKTVCAAPMTKPSGAGCNDPGAICDANSYCFKGTTTFYTCMPKGTAVPLPASTCDAATPCIASLACLGGTCKTPVPVNGACMSSADCVSTAPYCDVFAGGTCDTGLVFAPGSDSCKKFFSPPAAGGTDGGADASSDL